MMSPQRKVSPNRARRHQLPMTLKQHLKTVVASSVRCMEIEDELVAMTWDDPVQGLPEAAALAAEALKQMDRTFKVLPKNAHPFIWPIFVEERELVAELQQKHPADSETLQRVDDLLDQFSTEARVDEIAQGAVQALRCAAWRSELADRQAMENSAMSFFTASYQSNSALGWIPWERTAKNVIKRSFQNAMLAVKALGIEARRNTFSDRIFLDNAPNSTALRADHVGPLTDNAVNLLRKTIQDAYGFDAGRECLIDAIKALAEDASYNPVHEWLDGLVWDGTDGCGIGCHELLKLPRPKCFKLSGCS